MLKHKLKRLLTDQRLSRLVVVEHKEWTHALLGSYQEELRVSGEKTASQARQAWLLRRQHQLQHMANTKITGLDGTLDNLAGFADGSW